MSPGALGDDARGGTLLAVRIEGALYAAVALGALLLRFPGGWGPGLPTALEAGAGALFSWTVILPLFGRPGGVPTWASPVSTLLAVVLGLVWTRTSGLLVFAYVMPFHNMLASFEERPGSSVFAGLASLAGGILATLLVSAGWVDRASVVFWTLATGAVGFFAARRLRLQAGRLSAHFQERLALSEAMGRFTTDYLTRQVLREGLSREGERREVSVLFTDLRGFTALSERLTPREVVLMLNEYLSAMVRAVEEHRGHVNKFIGDAVMAVFGAPEQNPWHATDAVRTALAMRSQLAQLNERRRSSGLAEIRMGIGIHSGEVIAGVVGSAHRMEWTVIGDTVNVASRVESLNKDLSTDLLITEEVFRRIDPALGFRSKSSVQVRGKELPLTVYSVPEP